MKQFLTTRYVVAVLICLGVTVSVSAYGGNLYEHYNENLPSIFERVSDYELGFDDIYLGTEEQNLKFHDYLDGDILGALAFPPSTVEGTSTAGWTDDGSIVRLNTASDFVGIGTTNPGEKLTVTGGNFRLEGDITLIAGNVDYITGDISIGGGDINLGNGLATTTLTSINGDLGIGTTTPSNINATTTLAIQGDIFVTGTSTSVLNVTASTTRFSGGPPMAWPLTAGSSGQALTTDGIGRFSFTNVTAPAATSTIFTESGTWIRPAIVNSVIITVIGGGGGGGGVTTDSGDSAGGGGGSGGYAHGAVEVSGNVTVTIGAAGTAGSGNGGNGGNSSFAGDITITANGGSGGVEGAGGEGAGGSGGGTTVGNGVIGIPGETGENGHILGATQFSGEGGNSALGGGGNSVDGNSTGITASGCGGGGSGAADGGTTQRNGGAGFVGCVIVEWF